MKKIFISAVSLAIAACLSITWVSAKSFPDVKEDLQLESAVDMLSELGIVEGYEDGTFRPNSTISRAEACAIFTRVLPERSSSVAVMDMRFKDVEENTWSYDYVSNMAVLRIVEGYEDNTFRPADKISYQEFIKMVMSMLLYQPYAEENGGYPSGYLKAAEEAGITAGISFENDKDITRKDAAIMISRMLDVPLLRVKEYNVNGANVYDTTTNITYRQSLVENK